MCISQLVTQVILVSLGEWTQWSACSASDISAVQQREFRCNYGPALCTKPPTQTRSCQPTPHSIPDMASNYQEGLFHGRMNEDALVNHNLKELLVSSEIECALYCVRIPYCSSINIGVKDSVHSLLVCQLNNATVDSEPRVLISSNGFSYYSVTSRHTGDWGTLSYLRFSWQNKQDRKNKLTSLSLKDLGLGIKENKYSKITILWPTQRFWEYVQSTCRTSTVFEEVYGTLF